MGSGGGEPVWRILAFGVFGALIAGGAGLVGWMTTTWSVTDGAVQLRRGVLARKETVVPLARVQAVDTVHGPLQRFFGVQGVDVQTAGGGREGEIKLPAVAPGRRRAAPRRGPGARGGAGRAGARRAGRAAARARPPRRRGVHRRPGRRAPPDRGRRRAARQRAGRQRPERGPRGAAARARLDGRMAARGAGPADRGLAPVGGRRRAELRGLHADPRAGPGAHPARAARAPRGDAPGRPHPRGAGGRGIAAPARSGSPPCAPR